MNDKFNPSFAASLLRNAIVDEAPKLYAENQALRQRVRELEGLFHPILDPLSIVANQKMKLEAENARLQAAHDHQHAVAGTLLREAERVGRENAALRAAIVKCRAHTTYWSNADRELLDGLLASIARICDAALGVRHE